MTELAAVHHHPSTLRLQSLLESLRTAIDDEILAEAREVGPVLVTGLVHFMIDRALQPRYGSYAAIRSVQLAGELGLEGSVPSLARCLPPQQQRGKLELRTAALGALTRLGEPGADALLDAFDRCGTMKDRLELAEAVAVLSSRGERVRAALLRIVEELPAEGARLLVRRNDWRAVPDLMRHMDRIAAERSACTVCAALDLETLQSAVRILGGVLTDENSEHLQDVSARAEDLFEDWDEEQELRATTPAVRLLRPGRNAPCHCGSGKKYKKCCLAADERRRLPEVPPLVLRPDCRHPAEPPLAGP